MTYQDVSTFYLLFGEEFDTWYEENCEIVREMFEKELKKLPSIPSWLGKHQFVPREFAIECFQMTEVFKQIERFKSY